MGKLARKRRDNFDTLTDDLEHFLLYGRALFLGIIPRNRPTMEDLRPLWEQNRDSLFEKWQEKEPGGSTPFAEFYFQQPEPRDFEQIRFDWEIAGNDEEIKL
jgi:hypothetical protein